MFLFCVLWVNNIVTLIVLHWWKWLPICFYSTGQCDDQLSGSQEAIQSQPDDHHLHHSPLLSLLPRCFCLCHIHNVEVHKRTESVTCSEFKSVCISVTESRTSQNKTGIEHSCTKGLLEHQQHRTPSADVYKVNESNWIWSISFHNVSFQDVTEWSDLNH